MRRFAAYLAIALWLPIASAAQDDGEGFLVRLIERNLSSAGREVNVRGFQGALSARATLDELTIADADGVWLTLRGAVFDWDRSALLQGRLEIAELSAEELLVPRRPAPSGIEPPPPEATVFRLPDLPVAINIGRLSIGRAEIGAEVLGTAAAVRLQGSASLEDGSGRTDLAVERIDGQRGRFALQAAFANDTEDLALDLTLSEGANGIAANLIDLPGRPSVDMAVEGRGTLSNFAADLRLETDDVERLSGTVTLLAEPSEIPRAAPIRRFRASLGGDLAPVFSPQYRPFFGPDIRLVAAGSRQSDGSIELETMDLRARSVTLAGSLALAPDGLPR